MKHETRGFSLVEVLVALVVLSIGLLGVASMQVQAMKYNTDAYLRTQATTLAYDLIDRMRANNVGASNQLYVSNSGAVPTPSVNCDTQSCNTNQLATYDLSQWYNTLQARLPASATVSTVTFNGGQYTITIQWMERELALSQTWQVNI